MTSTGTRDAVVGRPERYSGGEPVRPAGGAPPPMEARNRRTGARIVGTAEALTATASVRIDGFCKRPDGRVEYEHGGTTEVHYDGVAGADARHAQRTVTDPVRGVLFVDENHEEVYEDEVDLVPHAGMEKPLGWEPIS